MQFGRFVGGDGGIGVRMRELGLVLREKRSVMVVWSNTVC
jgi:hypothetical protein